MPRRGVRAALCVAAVRGLARPTFRLRSAAAQTPTKPPDLSEQLSAALDDAAARADDAITDYARSLEKPSVDDYGFASRVVALGRRATALGVAQTAQLVDEKLRETELELCRLEDAADRASKIATLKLSEVEAAVAGATSAVDQEAATDLASMLGETATATTTATTRPRKVATSRWRRARAAFRTATIWRTAISQGLRVTRARSRFTDRTGPEAVAARARLAADFRDALIRLGPTFIKFGQLLSTRVDALPPEVIRELATLQNDVPSFDPARAVAIVAEELGVDSLDEVFATFDRTPLAAASLAQVHRATLKTGEEVVVKVQRERLRERFDVDCANIRFLARIADRLDPAEGGVESNWKGIADTSERVLYQEIDFRLERDAAVRFREAFEGKDGSQVVPYVKVPKTYDAFCTSKVLVLEYVPGVKINDVDALKQLEDVDLETVAQRLTFSYLEQLCRHGFFHCDPHPGNVAVDTNYPGGRLIYYDFGMMESIEMPVKKGFVDLIYALYKNVPTLACDAFEQMGVLRPGLDRFSVERIATNYMNSFAATVDSKNKRGVSGVADGAAQWETEMNEEDRKRAMKARRAQIGKDLFATQAERPFLFPPKFTFVFRALSTIDGIGKSLDPAYDLSRLSQPFLRELADLRDGSRYASALGEVLERVGWRPADVRQLVTAPRTTAATAKAVARIESGDLKLRVRSVELEAQLTQVETRQRLFGAAACAFVLAQAAAAPASTLATLLLRRGALLGSGWAGLEAASAWSSLRKAERNRKRFANEGGDV